MEQKISSGFVNWWNDITDVQRKIYGFFLLPVSFVCILLVPIVTVLVSVFHFKADYLVDLVIEMMVEDEEEDE